MQTAIETARLKAAHFCRVDLHMHSPLSHDWKNDASGQYVPLPHLDRIIVQSDIKEAQLAAYLERLEQSNIHVAAITDHMKYSFGLLLSAFARKRQAKILILPGIELNVKLKVPLIDQYRIHVLAIFPPDIAGSSIERIFPPNFDDEASRCGKKSVIEIDSIAQLVEKIDSIGGKAIAAHIYTPNGLRHAYTRESELILEPLDSTEKDNSYKMVGDSIKNELYKFHCLQVKATTDPVHYKDEAGEVSIPLIVASDSHHVLSFGADNTLTFIKMGEPNYNSFCDALRFPDTRIRFKSNLPSIRPPRIRGMRIVGQNGNSQAFFREIVIGFSDNLTCIIGPRGSGKSAIIDAIRYAMGYNRTLHEIPKVKQQILDRQSHTLQASRIELLYEKRDMTQHIITSTYDQKETYSTAVFDTDGTTLNIADVEAAGDYPLKLYGWNELELLGEDPKSQRESLDRFILELPALKIKKTQLYAKMSSNYKECNDQLMALEKFFSPTSQQNSFLRLKEFEKEFNSLNTTEIQTKFARLDETNKRISFLSLLKSEIESFKIDAQSVRVIDFESIIDKCESVQPWCKAFLENRLQLPIVNDSIRKHANEFNAILSTNTDIIDAELLILQKVQADVSKEIHNSIGEQQVITAELRNNAKKRLDTAQTLFAQYKIEVKKAELLFQTRKGILQEIIDLCKLIFATRNLKKDTITSKISIINENTFSISLCLNQEGDRSNFFSALESNSLTLSLDHLRKKKRLAYLISNKMTPLEFSTAILRNEPDALIHKAIVTENQTSEEYEIDLEMATRIVSANIPYENISDLNVRRYDREKMEKIMKVQQIEFDDEFFILLNGKPIQHCSPGQRCSAMLPIVTLTSDAPIFIDQPEDNLDNRLVSKAVFKILSKLKETRQIIVATHNPNILVSGDAEQVVVLNSEGEIANYGSIDDPRIVQDVIEIMEGGKEAFARRQKRYSSQLTKQPRT
jgi:DNA repair ATPase RecN/precorrin-6B methylase 1